MNAPEYVPLPCGVHDELEAFAVRREVVRIRFGDSEGAEQEVVGRIVDIWAEGGAEYLRTDDGTTIRLIGWARSRGWAETASRAGPAVPALRGTFRPRRDSTGSAFEVSSTGSQPPR